MKLRSFVSGFGLAAEVRRLMPGFHTVVGTRPSHWGPIGDALETFSKVEPISTFLLYWDVGDTTGTSRT